MLVNIPMKGHPELVPGSHRAAAGMLYTFILNLACGIPKQVRDDLLIYNANCAYFVLAKPVFTPLTAASTCATDEKPCFFQTSFLFW